MNATQTLQEKIELFLNKCTIGKYRGMKASRIHAVIYTQAYCVQYADEKNEMTQELDELIKILQCFDVRHRGTPVRCSDLVNFAKNTTWAYYFAPKQCVFYKNAETNKCHVGTEQDGSTPKFTHLVPWGEF